MFSLLKWTLLVGRPRPSVELMTATENSTNSAGTAQIPVRLDFDAHAAGLVVHPYTFRAENTFLPVDLRRGTAAADFGKAIDEQVTFLRTGIDGLFTDQADIGVLARSDAAAA